jgi:peptidoglycan hydrolase CwlO-like protein
MEDLAAIKGILPIGAAIVTLVMAWAGMKYVGKENAAKIAAQDEKFEEAIATLHARVEGLAKQIRDQWAKADQASLATQKFDTTINYIKRDIDRLLEEGRYQRRRGGG